MRPRKVGVFGIGVVLVLAVQSVPARELLPIELTTGSILRVERDSGGGVRIAAVNAPVEDIFKALMAKTGIQVKLPDNIHGRLTLSTEGIPHGSFGPAANLLERVAWLSGHWLKRAPDGTPKEVIPRFPEVYNLSEEERLAAFAVQINPTQPTTGIATGYFLFCGRYVPPPYRIAKTRLDPYRWEISINGIAFDGYFSNPPRAWVPPLPADGQFDYADRIDRYCKHLWRRGKAAGKAMRVLHREMSDFLKGQKFVKSFRINGYTIEFSTKDGKSEVCVLPMSYPPEGPMGSKRALRVCLFHLVRAIALEGKLKSPSEAEPIAIQLLLDQEFVAGPMDLDPAIRLERAKRAYQGWPKKLVEKIWGSTKIDYGEDSPATPASTEIAAEKRRKYLESSLVEGLVYYTFLGHTGGTSREALQALIAIAESDLPLDVKVHAAKVATSFSRDSVLWIVANLRPTVELKERLAADIARAKAKHESRFNRQKSPIESPPPPHW